MKFPALLNRINAINSLVSVGDIERFDLEAINGQNKDLPKFKDHDSVLALCRHFIPVFRKRVDDKGTVPVKDENGEDIWIVGGEEMPRSKMLELAREYMGVSSWFVQ